MEDAPLDPSWTTICLGNRSEYPHVNVLYGYRKGDRKFSTYLCAEDLGAQATVKATCAKQLPLKQAKAQPGSLSPLSHALSDEPLRS